MEAEGEAEDQLLFGTQPILLVFNVFCVDREHCHFVNLLEWYLEQL
jgi:hypothetical protein